MIMRITWGKLHPGKWDEFERTYKEAVAAHGKQIKGLLGRWLSRNSADPDSGFAVSMWANMNDLRDYEQSEPYKNISSRLQPFFIGEYNTYRSEIRYSENL